MMIKLKLSSPLEISEIVKEKKLKTIIIETGNENVYIPNEYKFIVTKKFLSEATHVFSRCFTLKKIDMENFDFSEITTMFAWFYGTLDLSTIIFPKEADCNKLIDLYSCFDTTNLQTIDLSFMEMPENKNVRFMKTFKQSKLKKIILPKCEILTMKGCFSECFSLEKVIAPVNIDLSLEDVLFETFDKCEKVQFVDFQKAKFNVENFVNTITHPNNKNNLPDSCVVLLP